MGARTSSIKLQVSSHSEREAGDRDRHEHVIYFASLLDNRLASKAIGDIHQKWRGIAKAAQRRSLPADKTRSSTHSSEKRQQKTAEARLRILRPSKADSSSSSFRFRRSGNLADWVNLKRMMLRFALLSAWRQAADGFSALVMFARIDREEGKRMREEMSITTRC